MVASALQIAAKPQPVLPEPSLVLVPDGVELNPSEHLKRFVERMRGGTLRLRDRAVAEAEGYRPLGPDFPGMGEHWVHPDRVAAGTVDPASPPVLTYVELPTGVTLAGAAFTCFLEPSLEPPPLFGSAASWRGHRMDEEALFLIQQPSGRGDVRWLQRLAIMRLWLLENPHGVAEQNNWRLPYLRLGLDAPRGAPVAAARAISLLAGEGYYAQLFDLAGWLDYRERLFVAKALAIHAARAQRWVLRARDGGVVEVDALAEVWRSLWRCLESELAPEAWQRLSELEVSR